MLSLLSASALAVVASPVAVVASPVAVVEHQVIAYNARDADAFAATYAIDARIYDADAGATPKYEGRSAIRSAYAKGFAALPDARVEIVGRTSIGELIADQELVVPSGLRALVVYRVHDGLIVTVWLHRVRS